MTTSVATSATAGRESFAGNHLRRRPETVFAPRRRPSVSRLQAFVRETTQRVGAHVVVGSIVLDENKVQHFQVRRRTSKSVGDIIADKSRGLHHRKGQFMGEAGREQIQIEQKVNVVKDLSYSQCMA